MDKELQYIRNVWIVVGATMFAGLIMVHMIGI